LVFFLDASSIVLIIVVLVGIMILSSAIGRAVSKKSPVVFIVIALAFGLGIWMSFFYYSAILSRIAIIGYFLYLFGWLTPYGVLIYGSALITAVVCVVFLVEVSLIAGWVPARLGH
jgi:hypothetical protein